MADSYYCFMTDIGKELQAKAHELGAQVVLDTISVGDGGGTVPTPTGKETALVNQVWSTGIGTKAIDAENKNIVWLKITIPADVGDFWIREFGVWAQAINDDGTLDPDKKLLFAYGNHAEYYKTLPIAGQSVTHDLSVPIVVSNVSEVTIKVSEVGYATKTQWHQSNAFINTIRKMYQFEVTSQDVLNSGDTLTFPTGILYPVEKNKLDLWADGVILIKNTDYAEPVTSEATADNVIILHHFPKGTVFHGTIHGFTTDEDLPTVDTEVPSSESTDSDTSTETTA
jgi:hypothetical protein